MLTLAAATTRGAHRRAGAGRAHQRVGVCRVSGAREGDHRARPARRPGDPERRHPERFLPSRIKDVQRADDDCRRQGRASAQAVMVRAARAPMRRHRLIASAAASPRASRRSAPASGGARWSPAAPTRTATSARPATGNVAASSCRRTSSARRRGRGAPLTWSPLGYRPSPHRPDAIVPLYAPGLPLLMALAQLIAGFCGAFLVVPLCGAPDDLAHLPARPPRLRRARHRVVGRGPGRDQPGVSVSADERDERRAGDRRLDARAGAGARAPAAGRGSGDERDDRHPAEPGAAGRRGDGVDRALGGARGAAYAAPRPRRCGWRSACPCR